MTFRFALSPVIAAVGLAFALSGCGAASKLTKMAELPADEVKKLEEEVAMIHDALDNAKDDAGSISDMPKDVDPSDLNPAKLKKALEDCWAEPIREVKAAVGDAKKKGAKAAAGKVTKAEAQAEADTKVKKGKKVYARFKDCTARKKDNAAKVKEIAPGGKQDFVKAKIASVDHLRKNVHFLNQQSRAIPGLLKQVAIVKGKNEAAHAATQKNPMAGAKEKKANEAEYKNLDARLDKLTKTLKEDLANLPGDLAGIATKTKGAFGK